MTKPISAVIIFCVLSCSACRTVPNPETISALDFTPDTIQSIGGLTKKKWISANGEMTETISLHGNVYTIRNWAKSGSLETECYTSSIDTMFVEDSVNQITLVQVVVSRICIEYGSDGHIKRETVSYRGTDQVIEYP
jgi:hypothetical protein